MNDIRLVATFEVEPTSEPNRILERAQCSALAEALAEDLARQDERATAGLLVLGGGLMSPGELLRPGLPAWSALAELSQPAANDPASGGQILAIGAHQGRLPDTRLMPAAPTLQGQLLALPVLLRGSNDQMEALAESLESTLFEQGGLHPPSRAAFSAASGLDTGHGQWMTLNDFIALSHVQMDTAGLGAFWPIVEHALLEPQTDQHFQLPGSLSARWTATTGQVQLDFKTFDQYDGSFDDYALFTSAYRSLIALLDVHGMDAEILTTETLDSDRQALVEAAGPSSTPSGVTEQGHPECGLVCWTLVEDQHQYHLYPLNASGLARLQADFRQRGFEPVRPPQGALLSADGQTLKASAFPDKDHHKHHD